MYRCCTPQCCKLFVVLFHPSLCPVLLSHHHSGLIFALMFAAPVIYRNIKTNHQSVCLESLASLAVCLQTFIAMGDVSAGIKHAVSCHHSDGMRQRPGGGHGARPN